LSEGAITSVDPELQDRFSTFLQQEDAVESPPPTEAEAPVAAGAEGEAQESAPEPEPEVGEVPAEDPTEPEPQAASSEDEDLDPVETISDLAKAFEVEEGEFLDHLQVPSRDGEGTVSLSEVIEAYTSQPANNEEARLHYEGLGQELQGEHDARLGELQKVTAALIAQVEAEPDVNWEMLRETDPGQYLKERESRDARRADVQRSLDAMDAEMKRRDTEAETQHQAWCQEQVQTLYRLRPDWQEADRGRVAMGEVTDYLVKTGYPKEQIDALEDARSILTVWRAAQWEKLQAKKPGVKKRLRLLPRTLRTGAREDAAVLSNEQEKAKERDQLRNRLADTGSVDDAAALMKGLL
jgi:hypothetical protein